MCQTTRERVRVVRRRRWPGPGVEFPPAALDLPRLFLNARIYSAHSQFPTHISYNISYSLSIQPSRPEAWGVCISINLKL